MLNKLLEYIKNKELGSNIERNCTEVPFTNLELYGIALFNNLDPLYSLYALANDSKWALIGLIFRDTMQPEFNSLGDYNKKSWYILESNIHPDFWGVQIHSWSRMLYLVGGSEALISIRKFIYKKSKPNSAQLKNVMVKYLGCRFEKNIIVGTLAIFHENIIEGNGTYFCSEVAAAILKDLGILDGNILYDNYVPADFSTERANGILKLTPDYNLSNEIKIQSNIIN